MPTTKKKKYKRFKVGDRVMFIDGDVSAIRKGGRDYRCLGTITEVFDDTLALPYRYNVRIGRYGPYWLAKRSWLRKWEE